MNVTDNSGDTITISLIHARVGLGCSRYVLYYVLVVGVLVILEILVLFIVV